MRSYRWLRSCSVALVVLASHAAAQSLWPWTLDAKLVAPDADPSDRAGLAVAAQGSVLLVGAPYDDQAAVDAGAVYAYRRSGGAWVLEQKILSSAPRPNGHFGFSVALDGSFAVIGSPALFALPQIGEAHVYRHDGTAWGLDGLLSLPGVPLFGSVVDISRDTIVVGAAVKSSSGGTHVRVFRRELGSWSLKWSHGPLNGLGTAVAIHEHTLLVSRESTTGPSVYAFHEASPTQWVQTEQLYPHQSIGGWGHGVALADGVAAIAGVSPPGMAKSLVEVYEFDAATSTGFELTGEFVDLGTQFAPTQFGTSMQFTEDAAGVPNRLVVGAPRASFTAKHDGMAHVFARFGPEWQRVARITAPDAAQFDQFGRGVAVTGNTIVVGAWQADTTSVDSGAVYTYDLGSVPTTYCTAKTASLGCAPTLAWSGNASASSGSGFVVDCGDTLPNRYGVLFYSPAVSVVPFRGGWLCIAPPLQRADAQTSSDGEFCDGAYSTDFNVYIASGQDPALVAGADVYCQWATRDPADLYGSGLSNALWFQIGP
jgi:hypothetical protein